MDKMDNENKIHELLSVIIRNKLAKYTDYNLEPGPSEIDEISNLIGCYLETKERKV